MERENAKLRDKRSRTRRNRQRDTFDAGAHLGKLPRKSTETSSAGRRSLPRLDGGNDENAPDGMQAIPSAEIYERIKTQTRTTLAVGTFKEPRRAPSEIATVLEALLNLGSSLAENFAASKSPVPWNPRSTPSSGGPRSLVPLTLKMLQIDPPPLRKPGPPRYC